MLLPAIDTHVHFWDLAQFGYPWLDADDCADIRADYLPADLAADIAGADVLAMVHVQAEVDHAVDPVDETAWLTSVLDAAPPSVPPAAIVGYADLRRPDLEDVLARHLHFARVRGIRQELWFDPASTEPGALHDDLLSDPAWVAGLRQLAGHSLSFDALVSASQLAQAAAVFREHPELAVILDHTGVPTLTDGVPPPEWRTSLRRFASEVPNSVLKISGMAFIQPAWRIPDVAPVVRESIETFGPARCMLGSNFPVDKPHADYARVWEAYDEITSDLSGHERAAIFSDTARRVYRIDDLLASREERA